MRGLCVIILASCVMMVTAKAWVLKIEAVDDGKDTLKLENPQESQSVALIRLQKKPAFTQMNKYTECYDWWCAALFFAAATTEPFMGESDSHLAKSSKMHPERWAKTVTHWVPQDGVRRRGRPRKRWRDDQDIHLKNWPEIALDRDRWKVAGEAFAQQWDQAGYNALLKAIQTEGVIQKLNATVGDR